MTKLINQIIISTIIATTINNAIICIPPKIEKQQATNDAQARQLTRNIEIKMESAKKATTPEERERLKNELVNDIEQAATYFDNVQNFFGYGPIAEKRRVQAEKQKAILEHKLSQEEIRYKTLTTSQAKQKSLKKQNDLKNKIHTEKIALGQAWSWKQKALITTLGAAAAYMGYQYGGTIASTAKEWWSGKPQDTTQSPTGTELVQTPSTISEQFSKKFTQLKEQGQAFKKTATEKIKNIFTPSVDQQAETLAQKAKQHLLWQAEERRKLEQTKQELLAAAQIRSDKQKQDLIEHGLTAQQRKLAAEQANMARLNKLDQRQKNIKINEYLKTQNLPPQQLKEYKQYLENLDFDEIPSTTTKRLNQADHTASYHPEIDTALPLRNISPEEQELQTQQYISYKKALNKSMSWREWLGSFFTK